MNYKEINKKYPKSCNLLEKYLGADDDYSASEFEYLTNGLLYVYDFEPRILGLRCLYEFFDEQNIIINIRGYKDVNSDLAWGWNIENFGDSGPFLYYSRIEAEEVAFLKAFEILETKLN